MKRPTRQLLKLYYYTWVAFATLFVYMAILVVQLDNGESYFATVGKFFDFFLK